MAKILGNRLKKTDPHASREAENYDNPIPSREYILEILEAESGPVTHPEMCQILGMTSEDNIEALRRRMIAMARDGQLASNRHGAFAPIDRFDLVRGRVMGHKDGFGFVAPQEGGKDIFLHNRQMRKVFDGDEVLVRLDGNYRGKPEGKIVEVLSHNTHQLVGRLVSESGVMFVRPDNLRQNHDVVIAPGDNMGALKGQFVVVEILQQPGKKSMVTGRIIEVLGDHMAPGMEIDVAIRSHSIPHLWPARVQGQAAELPETVDEADKKHRVDLRDLPFVTIDGEDARDFDDAVFCETKKSGGWRLYVAIADVSHYVRPESPLDVEAQERGTSVYFPDYVVPMLPEALSNGLCSLNPKVDRLAMVCEMTISASGKISGYKFYEGLIHSHARLTYNQVGQMIDERMGVTPKKSLGAKLKAGVKKVLGASIGKSPDKTPMRSKYSDLLTPLDTLHDIYQVFKQVRRERGAIEFETTETRIQFDQDRKIDQIVPIVRNDAHKLIEECMLAANVCSAKFLEKHGLPGLYRVHEGPSEQKLENLHSFLGELGLSLPGKADKPHPSDYQQLLSQVRDRPDAHLIQTVMLRSMSQAVYTPDNDGHFGLGYDAYTHFTSPIRRYPDLLTHRAIRHVIRSTTDSKHVERVDGAKAIPQKLIYPYDHAAIAAFGEATSTTERRADEATRDVMSWLKCEFLQDHIGDVFEGVVSAVTSFGVFVELKDLYVEGLVHISSLPRDFYHFEPAKHRLVGERTRAVYRLGDELTVRVAGVNLDDRKVDFELLDGDNKKSGGKAKLNKFSKKSGKASSAKKKSAKKPQAEGAKNTGQSGSAPSASDRKTTAKKPVKSFRVPRKRELSPEQMTELKHDAKGSEPKGGQIKAAQGKSQGSKTGGRDDNNTDEPTSKRKSKKTPSKGNRIRKAKNTGAAKPGGKKKADKKPVKKKAVKRMAKSSKKPAKK